MSYRSTYDPDIQRAAARFLPSWSWLRIKAELIAESDLDPNAVSDAGAKGIAQFMDDTWAEWRERLGLDPNTSQFDASASINCCCAYLRYLYDEWTAPRTEIDKWRWAVASYNTGLGNVLRAQRMAGGATAYDAIKPHLPDETVGYVSRIEVILSELSP